MARRPAAVSVATSAARADHDPGPLGGPAGRRAAVGAVQRETGGAAVRTAGPIGRSAAPGALRTTAVARRATRAAVTTGRAAAGRTGSRTGRHARVGLMRIPRVTRADGDQAAEVAGRPMQANEAGLDHEVRHRGPATDAPPGPRAGVTGAMLALGPAPVRRGRARIGVRPAKDANSVAAPPVAAKHPDAGAREGRSATAGDGMISEAVEEPLVQLLGSGVVVTTTRGGRASREIADRTAVAAVGAAVPPIAGRERIPARPGRPSTAGAALGTVVTDATRGVRATCAGAAKRTSASRCTQGWNRVRTSRRRRRGSTWSCSPGV